MLDTEDARTQRDVKELCVELEETARVLAGSDYFSQGDMWDNAIQPSGNLLWRLGCATCGPGRSPADANDCLRVLGHLKADATKHFVEHEHGPQAYQRMLAQVCITEAAAAIARDQTGTEQKKYLEEARAALVAAASPFGETASCDSIIALGIERLRGTKALRRAQSHLLLVGNGQHPDIAASFVMELFPGEGNSPLPDPLLGSIAMVDGEIVDQVCRSWADAKKRWPCEGRAGWWIESPSPLVGVDGPSAGASIYAVVRSLLEGVPIDSAVAISATLEPGDQDLRLGHVGSGNRKWRLAGKAHCDTLLLAPTSYAETKEKVPPDQQAGLPKLIEAKTFQEAWEHLTSETVILNAYRSQVSRAWLSQWSRIIDGENVLVLDDGTADHRGQPIED